MKKVILSNLMYFSSILVKNLALAKAMTPAHKITETPCLQGFSPFFDFAKIFAEKGEFGEKTRDSNRFVWAFRVSVLRRFPKKIFTIWSWLVGKYRQLTPKTKICSFSLLQNTKDRAIIPTQLNKNSIRASGGNLNRLDYQAPCESKWLWDNYIILYSNERCTVNGWTTERRASQNDTGLLYHFGSTAFFDARIARTT